MPDGSRRARCSAESKLKRSGRVVALGAVAAVLRDGRSLSGAFEAAAAGLDDPRQTAEEINLLHEGAISVAHITGDAGAARKAKAAAAKLIVQRG